MINWENNHRLVRKSWYLLKCQEQGFIKGVEFQILALVREPIS